jgi:AraC-like DNA-binding protein
MPIPRRNAWSYWLDRADVPVEYAFWRGDAAPDLATHFHADAQLTIVLSGGRAFQIGSELFRIAAGQCLYIPARSPHRGTPVFRQETRCLNIYAPIRGLGRVPLVVDIPELARDGENLRRAILGGKIALHLRDAAKRERPPGAEPARLAGFGGGAGTIGAIAARSGLSREGFSRKFARDVGMSPHAYRIVERLNEARRRLREGEAIAALAAELNFADQSHFGRQFRRVFGITPHAYRESMR